MRHRGEEVRWHFIDRFLGEGVALDYLGQERSRDGTCYEVLLVDDRKFGHYFEALFDCRTVLLADDQRKADASRRAMVQRKPILGPRRRLGSRFTITTKKCRAC